MKNVKKLFLPGRGYIVLILSGFLQISGFSFDAARQTFFAKAFAQAF
jgi:hypothetical protein